MTYKELMTDWIASLDSIYAKMERTLLASPMPTDTHSEEEFKDDLRSAMLSFDYAICDLKEVSEKLD